MKALRNIRCGDSESVFEALDRAMADGVFPARSYVGTVAKSGFGDSRTPPTDAIGTVTVRPYEAYWIMAAKEVTA